MRTSPIIAGQAAGAAGLESETTTMTVWGAPMRISTDAAIRAFVLRDAKAQEWAAKHLGPKAKLSVAFDGPNYVAGYRTTRGGDAYALVARKLVLTAKPPRGSHRTPVSTPAWIRMGDAQGDPIHFFLKEGAPREEADRPEPARATRTTLSSGGDVFGAGSLPAAQLNVPGLQLNLRRGAAVRPPSNPVAMYFDGLAQLFTQRSLAFGFSPLDSAVNGYMAAAALRLSAATDPLNPDAAKAALGAPIVVERPIG